MVLDSPGGAAPLTPEQHNWCQAMLDTIDRLSERTKKPVRQALKIYLENECPEHAEGGEIKVTTLHNRMTKVTQSAGPCQLRFVETRLLEILTRARSSFTPEDKEVFQDVRRRLEARGHSGYRSVSTPEESARRERALFDLLGIRASTLTFASNIATEYFGYRLSAVEGDIIRFYVSITKSGESNVLDFNNRFIRNDGNWTTKGFGITVDGITYVVGHAKSEPGKQGLGLRCISLVRYAPLGWLTGTLISVHQGMRTPIGARAVLVPLAHHNDFALGGDAVSEASLRKALTASISSTSLDRGITPRDENGADISLGHRRPSDYVQFLVRNWTLTALVASQDDLPDSDEDLQALREIWNLEDRLAHLRLNTETVNGRYLEALKIVLKDTQIK